MSLDLEHELRLAMQEFTDDVLAPPDLLARLPRRRMRGFPRLAVVAAAAAAAVTITGVVVVGEHAGGGGGRCAAHQRPRCRVVVRILRVDVVGSPAVGRARPTRWWLRHIRA